MLREFFAGVGLLGRGIGLWARSPRLMLIGALPALLAFVLLAAGYTVLCVFVADLATLVTPFAAHWAEGWRLTVRIVAGIVLLGGGLLLAVLLYTGLALAIGDPAFEAISRRVDDSLGGVPVVHELPWWRSIRRAVGDLLRTGSAALLVAVVLGLLGFVPVVGQVLSPVLGAFTGGWFLALELTGVAFERRGMWLADRRRALRRRRPLALGFGVATFLLFLIPLGAVVGTPAAVAGGTLLTRRALGENDHQE